MSKIIRVQFGCGTKRVRAIGERRVELARLLRMADEVLYQLLELGLVEEAATLQTGVITKLRQIRDEDEVTDQALFDATAAVEQLLRAVRSVPRGNGDA